MAVAADDRHPGLGNAQFRPDDVHDALVGRIHVEQRNAELAAIFLQCFNLLAGDRVQNRQPARRCRDVVIHRGHRAQRLADAASIGAQTVKGLRGRYFMHQMQVDIKERRLPLRRGDQMGVPDFFK